MKKVIALFFLVLGGLNVLGQQKDAVLWTSIQIEKKITRHFSATLFNQYSFNQNVSELGYMFVDAGVVYKYNSNLSASVNYRFAEVKNLANNYEDRQSLYADLAYSKGVGNFSFGFRTRYQVIYYGLNLENNYRDNRKFSRNKFTLRYKIDARYSVYVSEEQFFRWNTVDKTVAWRTSCGLFYQFNLYNRIELFYFIQNQVNRIRPRTDYVSGITYYYKF